jgi:hypothetical protein
MAYKVLELLGYYRIKKSLKHRLFCRKLLKEDTRRKQEIRKAIDDLQGAQLRRKDDESDVVVSLTSYGVRVNDTLPFTLFSLFCQTRLPNRIIVWLDNVNWNEDTLPPILKKIKELGVEFFFVEDIRSYKKLIPALEMFPDNVIITVDDDLYYNPKTVEWLIDAYQGSDKHSVFGTWAYPARVSEGHYLPYSSWKGNESADDSQEYALIGCGGILYPPHIFDDEILKKDLFMKMAPTADDLWFWVMEKRQNIPVRLIPNAGYGLHEAVNRIDVWEPNREGSLYYINEIHGANDIQFRELVSHYRIIPPSE